MTKLSLAVITLLISLGLTGCRPLNIGSLTEVPSSDYIAGSETNTQPAMQVPLPTPEATILFGGDLMFDRNIRLKMEKSGIGFVLSPLAETFQKFDVVVANLEGPVTTNPSRSVGSTPGSTNNFIFTFDPSILPMLKQHRFTISNIGNNHIGNFGTAGIAETKQRLQAAGIEFFGNTGQESSSSARVLIKEIQGTTFGFVNLNQFTPQGFESAVADVQYARPLSEVVIVMPHWGNEYVATAGGVIREQAHDLVDVGADLIVGAHPHVIQQKEQYRGKWIYYSLGNFVFDQYFSPETKQGLLVGVTFKNDGTQEFTEIPIRLEPTGQTLLR